MTTLAKDTPRDLALGFFEDYPVIASDIIYEGAAVGDNASGYARPLVAGDPFRGFATQRADNSAGSAGDIRVRTLTHGRIVLPISAAAITDIGKEVFASDDNAFTFTEGSNSFIGYVDQWLATGSVVVAFNCQKGSLSGLTDSSGGTASTTTVEAIGGTYSQSEIRNNFATLAAKINKLIIRLGG